MNTVRKNCGVVCTNCTNWFWANIDLGVEVDLDLDDPDLVEAMEETKKDLHIVWNPDAVSIVCDSCGHRMQLCDPEMAEIIGNLTAHGFRTNFSSQGHYRMKETFDGQADLVKDPVPKAYQAKMVAERPCINFSPYLSDKTKERQNADCLNMLSAIRDAAVRWNREANLAQFTDVVTEATFMVPSGNCSVTTETRTCTTDSEYFELVDYADDLNKKYPDHQNLESISISIPWPTKDGHTLPELRRLLPNIGSALTESFGDLMVNMLNNLTLLEREQL